MFIPVLFLALYVKKMCCTNKFALHCISLPLSDHKHMLDALVQTSYNVKVKLDFEK